MTFEQSLAKIEGTLRSYVAEVDHLQEDKRRLREENSECRAALTDLGDKFVSLHSVNAELLAAAKAALHADDCDHQVWADLRNAIAKAEEHTP